MSSRKYVLYSHKFSVIQLYMFKIIITNVTAIVNITCINGFQLESTNHTALTISWCVYVHSWRSLGCSAAVLERGHLNFVSHTADAACIASDHHKLVARENCN